MTPPDTPPPPHPGSPSGPALLLRPPPGHPLLWLGLALLLLALFGEIPRALRWPARLLILLAGAWGLAHTLLRWRKPLSRLLDPFRYSNRPDLPLLALFTLMHGVLLHNAAFHYCLENYDHEPHRQNARIWSELRPPRPHETRGIHYAPLAYWPTALALRLGAGEKTALKAAQLANVLYSAVLVWFLLRLARLASPASPWAARAALLALATLPVYYKTFAMPRPEPMLAMWCVIAGWLAIRIFCHHRHTWPHFLLFGLATGLMLLTRQWGAFLFPAFALLLLLALLRRPAAAPLLLGRLAAAAALAILVAGWYYALLTHKYGSPAAFNSDLSPFSLANKPPSFYLDWLPRAYFEHPVIYTLGNRLVPILLADTWGDYWGYWHLDRPPVRTPETEIHPAVAPLVPYLSRVSAVSLLCSALLAAGLLAALLTGLRRLRSPGPALASALFILSTCAGFFVFVVCYSNPTAIKPSYIIQIAPFLALAFGLLIETLRRRRQSAAFALLALYTAAALHQAPLFLTGKPRPSEAALLAPFAPPLLLATLAAGLLLAAWLLTRRTSSPPAAAP